MKIALLVPRLHFHAPFALRALVERCPEHEYLVVTTPKLPGAKQPLWSRVARLVAKSGGDYVASMAMARLWHGARGTVERCAKRPLALRRSLSVNEAARALGAELWTTPSIGSRDAIERLRRFAPDVLCAIFFNQIVPQELIDLPRLGALNLHPSRLPWYRGVSPCFWVLARGEPDTGVTLHRLTARIDQGPILAQRSLQVLERDSVDSLYRRCAVEGGELLAQFISEPTRWIELGAEPEGESSYHSTITRAAVRSLRAQGRKFF